MLIVADENIGDANRMFAPFGKVVTMPASEIDAQAVRNADVLLVRSVTRVDRDLLQNSGVGFVGSATIGTDHVDLAYLESRNIRFAYAPGSNAGSVVEYVLAALFLLADREEVDLSSKKVGIVGCGHIGGALAGRLAALGTGLLLNDPPMQRRAEQAGQSHPFVPLEEVVERSDIVSLHVPLTNEGPDATRHLFEAGRLMALRPGHWLINTSRGAVVDNRALLDLLGDGHNGALVLDVWEGEPAPEPELVRRADIATPHIAGYSYDGKIAGTYMLVDAMREMFGEPAGAARSEVGAEEAPIDIEAPEHDTSESGWLHGLTRQAYAIAEDHAAMQAVCRLPAGERARAFTELRRTYPRKYAFERFRVGNVSEARRRLVTEVLRMQVR